MLLTLAFGLASVPFYHSLRDRWNKIPIELPVTKSESPIYIFPKLMLTQPANENWDLVSTQRDLSLYEFGGQQSDCGMMFYSTEQEENNCKTGLEKSRSFILGHWQTKTKGYIYLKSTTVDATRYSQIFIEPDKSDNWHISWITEGWNGTGSSSSDDKKVYITNMYSVRLKRVPNYNYKVQTKAYYLSFLNKEGEELETW